MVIANAWTMPPVVAQDTRESLGEMHGVWPVFASECVGRCMPVSRELCISPALACVFQSWTH